MKILLLGHKGYLGSYLLENLKVDTIYNTKANYDYVINCIGKPSVEFCESNPEISRESNFEIVEKTLKDYPKSKMIHFSSYYVYDDEDFCTEDSRTTNKYNYMKHKLMSENIVDNSKGVCFRIGKLFGHPNIHKGSKLTEYIINNENLTLDKIRFNPTSLNQVLKIIEFELREKRLFGIFNLSNKGYTTHAKYGFFITDFLNLQTKIKVVETINRIFRNYGRFVMNTNKIEKYTSLNHWQTDMIYYLQKVRKCL